MKSGAIELVHGRRVASVPVGEHHEASVYLERVDVLELDAGGATLTAGPLVLRVMVPDDAPTMTGEQARALARTLDAAADRADAIEAPPAAPLAPRTPCVGWHQFTLGRCYRCGASAHGDVESVGR